MLVSTFKDFRTPTGFFHVNYLLNMIQNGYFIREILLIRELFSKGNYEKANILKKKLLHFTPAGTFSPIRNNENLILPSGLFPIDLDHLDPIRIPYYKTRIKLHPLVYAAFISPSGEGLKVFFKSDYQLGEYYEKYEYFKNVTENLLEVQADATSDICRLCFVSYDPDIYIREPNSGLI